MLRHLSFRKEKVILRFVFCTLLVIVFSSCSFNLAQKPIYGDYMNKPLAITHNMELYSWKTGVYTFWGHGRALKPGELYGLSEINGAGDPAFSAKDYYEKVPVKAGAVLRIHKIYSFYGDGWYEVRVLGEIYVESIGKRVPFVYFWPKKGDILLRAAWEDESVPAERYIGAPENRINFENR